MANSYGIHSGYFHPTLRKWQSGGGTTIAPHNLMLPIFVVDDEDGIEPIGSMPGVLRMGINTMAVFLEPLVAKGLEAVLLFSVTNILKDDMGEIGAKPSNPTVGAIKRIKRDFPNLLVAVDVCLCPYTISGHCGVLKDDGFIDNQKSLTQIVKIAKSFVVAGADVIAPSDMMDGRIKAIKDMLQNLGYLNRVSVMSYSVKFASSFYGPFREAAHSAPAFGDRKRYQLPLASRGLAMRAAKRDEVEGADMLMVKPGIAYLDIVREVKERHPELPMAIYQVSGEYAMLHHGAAAGAFDLKAIVMETLTAMRRSGADIIITYFTPQLLDWLMEK